MSTVEFHNIVKRYGRLTVLERLNLRIDDGEFLVLLGPSGCGKTTLLNILAGLLEIDDGYIFIGDREVSQLDPKDRGLAMVFQSYALYPTKTVRGNLRFGLSARKLPATEIEQRIAWAAKLLQIEHLLDRKPAQLSGGQRQRVAIGRALVKEVDVCLFDEPLSNLDAKLRTEMRMEIKKLHAPPGGLLRLDLPVQFVERSGPETVAFLSLHEKLLAVRAQSHTAAGFSVGATASVRLPLNKICVFEADTGRRM